MNIKNTYRPATGARRLAHAVVAAALIIAGQQASAESIGSGSPPPCLSTDWPHESSELRPDPDLYFGRLDNGFRYVLKTNKLSSLGNELFALFVPQERKANP